MPEYDAMRIALDMAHAETRDAMARIAEARAAEAVKLRPCPFCGSDKVDPEGWCSTKDNVVFNHGPACDECGGSAEDIARWNTRPLEDGGTHLEMPAEVIDQAISSLQALHIELDEQDNHAIAAKVNEVMSALMEAEQDALATEE